MPLTSPYMANFEKKDFKKEPESLKCQAAHAISEDADDVKNKSLARRSLSGISCHSWFSNTDAFS